MDISKDRDAKDAWSIQEILQMVEDILIEQGYEQLVIHTERGAFRWAMSQPASEPCANYS